MAKLTDYRSYADAQAHATSAALWDLFDGDREDLNIAHECITRHADGSGRAAVRIAHADGRDEILSFDAIAAGAARFAHWLDAEGIQPGERIAFMLEPSLPFYVCLFGAMQTGAISVNFEVVKICRSNPKFFLIISAIAGPRGVLTKAASLIGAPKRLAWKLTTCFICFSKNSLTSSGFSCRLPISS